MGDIAIFWDNPFIGSNSSSVNTPPSIQAHWGDISGNNASVSVTLLPNF